MLVYRKLCLKNWILAQQIKTLPKKKSRNTTKCHNIFILHLFLATEDPGMIFYYFILEYAMFTTFS